MSINVLGTSYDCSMMSYEMSTHFLCTGYVPVIDILKSEQIVRVSAKLGSCSSSSRVLIEAVVVCFRNTPPTHLRPAY